MVGAIAILFTNRYCCDVCCVYILWLYSSRTSSLCMVGWLVVNFLTFDMLQSMSSYVVLNLFFIVELYCIGLCRVAHRHQPSCVCFSGGSTLCFISVPPLFYLYLL